MYINKFFISIVILTNVGLSQLLFNFNSQVSPTLSIQQYFPDLAVDDDGVIHIVWVEQTANFKNIFYSHSEDYGMTFTVKNQINNLKYIFFMKIKNIKIFLRILWINKCILRMI